MRAIWKGAINFGLVNIPIKLLTATSKKNIKFRYLHAECNSPVKMKRYCPVCKKEVEYEDLVKGYEYEDNRFVVLRDVDFDNIPVKSTRTIDIIDFVDLAEIDPIYYIKTYYLQMVEGGEKPYLLLRNALEKTGRVAISRITIRSKESLAVVRVLEGVLALETMFFADEVRSSGEIEILEMVDRLKISTREEEMAVEIVNNLTADFSPDKYENNYRQQLMKIIRAKIEGEEIKTAAAVEPEAKVIDLMEKLKASVEATEKREKTRTEELQ